MRLTEGRFSNIFVWSSDAGPRGPWLDHLTPEDEAQGKMPKHDRNTTAG